MFGSRQTMRKLALAGIAVAVTALFPSIASAAWLGYKNETNAIIVVQSAAVVNGQVIRGKPHQLYPGEVAWDTVPQPGVRQVSIFDPRANNRLVAQDNVNCTGNDLFLSVQVETPPPPRPGQPAQPPRVKLVPSKPTTPPPAK
jgi:hypothetical protein